VPVSTGVDVAYQGCCWQTLSLRQRGPHRRVYLKNSTNTTKEQFCPWSTGASISNCLLSNCAIPLGQPSLLMASRWLFEGCVQWLISLANPYAELQLRAISSCYRAETDGSLTGSASGLKQGYATLLVLDCLDVAQYVPSFPCLRLLRAQLGPERMSERPSYQTEPAFSSKQTHFNSHFSVIINS
jgi:hypothetical protein